MPDTFSKLERSRIMAAVKSKGTSPEQAVRRIVSAMHVRYRLHVRKLPGTPDLVLHGRRKVINVHGCFWHMHGCGRCRIPAARRAYWVGKLRCNAVHDARNRRRLRRMGWRVLTVWECQLAPKRLTRTTQRLRRFLESSQ